MTSTVPGVVALLALTHTPATFARFFGEFDSTPLPSSGALWLFAIGAAGISLVRVIGGR